MRITAKVEYACLALIELARPGPEGTPLRTHEIALAQGIPERYLVQILLQLKAAGLVQSVRGSVGGYRLARRGNEVSVADVIVAIEGRGEPSREPASPAAKNLVMLLDRANSARWAILAGASIADLAIEPTTQGDYMI
jgi:Rrf2 family cysteine metabolism transcriptional repressor